MEAVVIVAILTLLGQILLAFFQNKKLKSEANRTDIEASTILIDRALSMSKQENDTLRLLNDTLRKELDSCKAELVKKDEQNMKLRELLDACKDSLSLVEDELEKKER